MFQIFGENTRSDPARRYAPVAKQPTVALAELPANGNLADNPRGLLGGFEVGANRPTGAFIYGFATDLSHAGIRDNVIGPFLIPPFNFMTMDGQRLEWFGTLRARAGVTFDRSLLFITGGLAYGRASVSTSAIDTSANICGGTIKFCVSGYSQSWMAGWTLGAGWEYAVAANWSAKLEYLYYDLGMISNSMVDILAPPDNFRGSTDIRGNIVRVGLNYKFAN
jgi:outer membrane immunogenic protein